MKEKVRGKGGKSVLSCGGKAGEVRGGDARAEGEGNGVGCFVEVCWLKGSCNKERKRVS
jgi:hypothetical protein